MQLILKDLNTMKLKIKIKEIKDKNLINLISIEKILSKFILIKLRITSKRNLINGSL